MLKAETIEIAGLNAALKAVRLPHNGKEKSEIQSYILGHPYSDMTYQETQHVYHLCTHTDISVHEKDLKLIQNLEISGDHHAKVVRGIVVWVKITAPVYLWSEIETYVVGHQRLSSTSTMHTEGKGLFGEELQKVKAEIPMGRELTKVDYFSYQTLRRMAFQRHNHRLPEWHQLIDWMHTLPLAEELIFKGLDKIDNGDPELKLE